MINIPVVLRHLVGWPQEFGPPRHDIFQKKDYDKIKYGLYSHHTKF